MPALIASVQAKMRDKKLVIADGHHRYETALNFRDECRAAAGTGSNPQAPYEFVMMTFVNMNDPGLLVLPTHRVVHSLGSFSADEFQKSSSAFFEVEEVDPRSTPPAPPPFCTSAAATEPPCWRSPPTAHSCCTLQSPQAPSSLPGSPLASRRSMSCNCTNACWKAC